MAWDNKTRPNKTAKIPYAYKADDDDPLVLVPDQDLVPMVEQAMDYLDEGHSSRRTADWLSEKSGKTISHQGLSNIWKAHRSETSELLKSRKKQRRKNAPKTESEKRAKAAKRKRSDAKRVLTMAEKKIDKCKNSKHDVTLLKFAQVNKLSFDYSNKKMPRSRRGQSNRECGRGRQLESKFQKASFYQKKEEVGRDDYKN